MVRSSCFSNCIRHVTFAKKKKKLKKLKIKIKITGPEISTWLMSNDCINLFNACSNPGPMKL
jgi:hypothetical protein